MNFSKLSKEKRTQLVLVVLATLVILGLLGFVLIKGQYEDLGKLAAKKLAAHQDLEKMDTMIKNADRLAAEVGELNKALAQQENNMGSGSGDFLSWFMGSMKNFRKSYKVEIPQYGPAWTLAEVNLLPGFPYKQVTISVAGSGFYHDVGRFIADFENEFPHARVVNLELDLNPTATAAEREKLAFRMDVVTLVKPTP